MRPRILLWIMHFIPNVMNIYTFVYIFPFPRFSPAPPALHLRFTPAPSRPALLSAIQASAGNSAGGGPFRRSPAHPFDMGEG